jgi:3-deoxy-7-phosphoheptulonate synthase
MAHNNFRPIKPPGVYKTNYPLTAEDLDFIYAARQQVCKILCRTDHRLVIILGPCSIHHEGSAVEYAARIRELQEKIQDTALLVMRFYFEKPRTRAGWKGLMYDPFLDGSEDLEEGIDLTRKLMTQITRMRVPMASEIVDPMGFYYFSDLLAWLCIGARTSSSQVHRQNASGMPMAVGFKNDLGGSIANAINSIIATDSSHTYMAIDDDGKVGVCQSTGAPFAHIVLRGSKGKPNYDKESIDAVIQELDQERLMDSLIVDCSHENCNKNHNLMPEVFEAVVHQILEGNRSIRGIMLESHLHPGSQRMVYDITKLDPRVSITDPCIGWEKTEELLSWAHQHLEQIHHVGA